MTIKEVAKILGLKVRTIREWIKTGRLKAVKVRNHWEIPESEVRNEEVLRRANEGREHSKRIKAGIELGMLARGGEDTKESV